MKGRGRGRGRGKPRGRPRGRGMGRPNKKHNIPIGEGRIGKHNPPEYPE